MSALADVFNPPPAAGEQIAIQYPTEPSGYTLHSKIGQGAFATVYLATLVSLPTHKVAIKVLSLDSCSTNLKDISREVQTMRLAKHANVLTCHCSFVNKSSLWLVMDFLEKGTHEAKPASERRVQPFDHPEGGNIWRFRTARVNNKRYALIFGDLVMCRFFGLPTK